MQGTLYPDVVESGGGTGTANIKSHHNVGGLPEDLQFELVEPLRTLFKDEVRAIGRELGLPEVIVGRQPFPGPGLGIRIVGEVTADRLELLRDADAIAREELTARRPRPARSGSARSCCSPTCARSACRATAAPTGTRSCCARCRREDAMTADWTRLPYDVLARISNRITNEVARGQPRRARRHVEAAGHHRVGVTRELFARNHPLFARSHAALRLWRVLWRHGVISRALRRVRRRWRGQDGTVSEFPDAEYLVLSSRLIPDRDGGYTLATLARARQMAAAGVHGGLGPLLLTLDPGTAAEHARHRASSPGATS